MATDVVVDSSAIVAFVTKEEYSDWISEKLPEYNFFHILDLDYYEVANGLNVKMLRKELTTKEGMDAFTKAVKVMNLYAIHNFSEIIADSIALASELKLTVYDAAFVSLAEKLDVRLLTLDKKLVLRLRNTKYRKLIDSPY